MRVLVDFDRCDSTGLCTAIAPEVFELDERDQLVVLTASPSPDQWAATEDAARSCPKLAIALVDED
jgi:ferredoxin